MTGLPCLNTVSTHATLEVGTGGPYVSEDANP